MQNIWILFLILVFHVGPVLAQSELGPRLGYVKEDQYSIQRTGVGIERYVEGKRQNDPFERWDFQCGKDNPRGTYCSVTRTVFTNWSVLGTVINRELHTTFDGSLKLTNADWGAGELDFQLILGYGNTIEVKLRVQYQDGSIYLKDFQAMEIARMSDKMEVIEYRIPEYTYTRDIPIGMRGLQSEDAKEREEMLLSLSEEDRLLWEKIGREGVAPSDSIDIESRMRELIPDYEDIGVGTGKRNYSPEEREMLGALMLENYERYFGAQGFSDDGLKKILDLMEKAIR